MVQEGLGGPSPLICGSLRMAGARDSGLQAAGDTPQCQAACLSLPACFGGSSSCQDREHVEALSVRSPPRGCVVLRPEASKWGSASPDDGA